MAQARASAELGALVGAAEQRLATAVGGGAQWRGVVEGRLEAARARWQAGQQDYSQCLRSAAMAAGITVEAGTVEAGTVV